MREVVAACPELANRAKSLSYNCPICGRACESKDYSETLAGYNSPRGHDHDDNCRKFRFACRSGHHFSVRVRNICPTEGCDWKGKESCPCHPGVLLAES